MFPAKLAMRYIQTIGSLILVKKSLLMFLFIIIQPYHLHEFGQMLTRAGPPCVTSFPGYINQCNQ